MKSFKALLISVIIASLTVLGFSGCIEPKTYQATSDDLFNYTLLEDGTYAISAKDVAALPESVYIPKEYEGKAVSTIAEGAFKNAMITELCLPSNIKVVSKNAFNGCKSLAKVYFYKGLVEIQAGAFYGCVALEQLNLPSSLQIIGESAFVGCAIRKLSLPEKVVSIGSTAFAYCSNLASVYIGHNVSEIAENAFVGVSEEVEFEISASNAYYKLDENGNIVKKA